MTNPLNRYKGFTSDLRNFENGARQKVGQVQDTVNGIEQRGRDVVNRAQNAVDNAKRGIDNAVNTASSAYNQATDLAANAGKTFNKIVDGVQNFSFSSINPFGGSDEASQGGIKAAGSGDSGASPGHKIAAFASDPKKALPDISPLNRDVSAPFKRVDEAAKGALDYLSPGKAGDLLKSGWTTLTDMRDGALKAIGTDYDSVKRRLESTMKIAGQIAKLPGEVQREVNGYMQQVNNVKQDVTSVIDGVTHSFDSFKDLDDYLKIDNLIGSFTRGNDFNNMDIDTSSALIYGISNNLSRYNLTSKVDPLISAISDPAAQTALYGELIVQAAANGSLDSVEYYATKLQTGQGAIVCNDVVRNLLSYLAVPRGVNYTDYGKRILALFTKLDPKWDESLTEPGKIELRLYSYANANAIQALLTTAKRPYVIAAGTLRVVPVQNIVDQYYTI